MKKTLRGKRYIRSRASVRRGRDNKQNQKMARFIAYIEKTNWDAVIKGAFQVLIDAINHASDNLRSFADGKNNTPVGTMDAKSNGKGV